MGFPSRQNRDLCQKIDLNSYMQAADRLRFRNRLLLITGIGFLLSLFVNPYLTHHPFHNHSHAGRYLLVISATLLLYAMASTRVAWKDLDNFFEQ